MLDSDGVVDASVEAAADELDEEPQGELAESELLDSPLIVLRANERLDHRLKHQFDLWVLSLVFGVDKVVSLPNNFPGDALYLVLTHLLSIKFTLFHVKHDGNQVTRLLVEVFRP